MAFWSEVERAAPALAAAVQARFDAHGLALLATLRRDGAPRISGIETLFAMDNLWMGMMPGSRKALDLLRDPRFALHSATIDKQVTHGDARIAGAAINVDDEAVFARYRQVFAEHTGYPPPPGPFQLFRADVHEMSLIGVQAGADHLDIDWWREGQPPQRVERH